MRTTCLSLARRVRGTDQSLRNTWTWRNRCLGYIKVVVEEAKELVGWVSIDVERVLADFSDVVVLENVDVWLMSSCIPGKTMEAFSN